MWSFRDGQKLGSLQRDLPFLKDLIDHRLTGYPRAYLFVERLRAWANWDKRVYLSFVRRGNIVLDIGANVGTHTVFFSHLVGNHGRVLAFEPLSENIDALKETIRLRSRNPNIRIIQAAVGAPGESGRRVVMTAPEEDLTQASLRVQAAGSWREQSAREYEVSLTSLDAEREVRDLPSIDVIKIDVEGGELDVLKGGAQTLRRHHPLIYCEIYEQWAATFGYAPADLFSFVRFLGYTGARVISNGVVHALPLDRDPPPAMFETSSDVVFFTEKHRQLVGSFDKRYLL
jgi:FkbM family methyltransferase